MLSKRLKETRKRKKLTQQQLANLLNTTKGTISNYENEYSSPSNEMLKDLANVLGVTTDYLLGRSNDPGMTEEDYLKSIIKSDDNFDGIIFEKDGKPLDLEAMLKFLEDKDITLKGELLTGEERRRAIEVLKAMFDIKKDT